MKKTFYAALALAAAVILPSCMEVDNVDGPDSSISGTVYDETTGKPFEGARGETSLRIWEMSFSPANMYHRDGYDLTIKEDGTYANTKLFKGTYDMLARSGPWWPCDTVFDVKIGPKGAVQDFYVTPYLKLTDFTAELTGPTTLTMSCRITCPYPDGKDVMGKHLEMPNIKEVRPFLSLTQFCGAGNRISYYYSNTYRANVNKPFASVEDPEMPGYSKVYTFNLPVKEEYIYTVRMGANCNDEFQAWNYTPCIKITVPSAKEWEATHPADPAE